jgi:tRNA (guanine-N(7)-)-methyltransferase subunit TRM82
MPKRPCAVALTSDDTTIVCGDKFGDVYSIPLLFSRSSADPQQHGSSTQTEYVATKSSTPFVPAANDLTVHSIRNRKALQNQLKQKHDATQKSELQFEHKLLLGHVSMLTDIALIQRNGKSYIITADRDEHIRFSRGIPQAHIIEGYCLGHTEFVSRLCFPAGRPNLLISGGGDDEIYVWDWCLGKLIHKVNVKIHIQRLMTYIEKAPAADNEVSKLNIPSSETVKMAVSNIEYVSGTLQQHDDLIMVTCEGLVLASSLYLA